MPFAEQQHHCSRPLRCLRHPTPLIPPLGGMEGPLRTLATAPPPLWAEARFNPRLGGQPGHFPDELPRGPWGPSYNMALLFSLWAVRHTDRPFLGHQNSPHQLPKSPETESEGLRAMNRFQRLVWGLPHSIALWMTDFSTHWNKTIFPVHSWNQSPPLSLIKDLSMGRAGPPCPRSIPFSSPPMRCYSSMSLMYFPYSSKKPSVLCPTPVTHCLQLLLFPGTQTPAPSISRNSVILVPAKMLSPLRVARFSKKK